MLLWSVAFGGDSKEWQKSVTTVPGTFAAPRPFTAQYDFGWSGIKAGEGTFELKRLSGGNLQLEVTLRSIGGARALWQMDSTAVSICRPGVYLPISLRQTEIYSRSREEVKVDYFPEYATRVKVEVPPPKVPEKPKTQKIANLHDLHSALQFIRSQKLADGDRVAVAVFPGGAPYLAEVNVKERVSLKIRDKVWQSIHGELKLQGIEKKGALRPYKKFKSAEMWVSDDADRLLLKVRAELFVGAVFCELRSVTFEE
jgi:hypothetical protein